MVVYLCDTIYCFKDANWDYILGSLPRSSSGGFNGFDWAASLAWVWGIDMTGFSYSLWLTTWYFFLGCNACNGTGFQNGPSWWSELFCQKIPGKTMFSGKTTLYWLIFNWYHCWDHRYLACFFSRQWLKPCILPDVEPVMMSLVIAVDTKAGTFRFAQGCPSLSRSSYDVYVHPSLKFCVYVHIYIYGYCIYIYI